VSTETFVCNFNCQYWLLTKKMYIAYKLNLTIFINKALPTDENKMRT
jgi:hypothetical protein